MKTIAPAAMAAIDAGTAIVSGAVEITPLQGVDKTAVVNVPGTSFTGTSAARTTTLTGFGVGDTVTLSKPHAAYDSRLSFDAYSAWAADNSTSPTPPPVIGQTWSNSFAVYGSDGVTDTFLFAPVMDPDLCATEADAFDALAAQLPLALTGYSTYKVVVFNDPNPGDNRGGISLLLTGDGTGAQPDPIRFWGGYGNLSIAGDEYIGIGARGFAQQNGGAVGGIAQGMTLGLSGIEPAVLDAIDTEGLKGASVVLYRLIFDKDEKTLLDAHVFDRGRVDTVPTEETKGGTAMISVAVESSARGLGRAGARMRADSDQRLIDPNDGYFRNVSYAGHKTLYWGGRKPTHYGGNATRGM